MEYRCVAASIPGFVQQLASCYLPHGYWFYVSGLIPAGKAPEDVDRKLIAKYGIGRSRQSRARRKAQGIANLHYLRCQRQFVLLATHGHHPFYEEEGKSIRDCRRIPIKFAGYSISVKMGGYLRRRNPGAPAKRDSKWRVHVQIGQRQYLELKAYFLDIAPHRSASQLAKELYDLSFEPYAPVRQQLLNILRLVNEARKRAGLESISPRVLRYRRQIVRPFDSTYRPDDVSGPQEDIQGIARAGAGETRPSNVNEIFLNEVLNYVDKKGS